MKTKTRIFIKPECVELYQKMRKEWPVGDNKYVLAKHDMKCFHVVVESLNDKIFEYIPKEWIESVGYSYTTDSQSKIFPGTYVLDKTIAKVISASNSLSNNNSWTSIWTEGLHDRRINNITIVGFTPKEVDALKCYL